MVWGMPQQKAGVANGYYLFSNPNFIGHMIRGRAVRQNYSVCGIRGRKAKTSRHSESQFSNCRDRRAMAKKNSPSLFINNKAQVEDSIPHKTNKTKWVKSTVPWLVPVRLNLKLQRLTSKRSQRSQKEELTSVFCTPRDSSTLL